MNNNVERAKSRSLACNFVDNDVRNFVTDLVRDFVSYLLAKAFLFFFLNVQDILFYFLFDFILDFFFDFVNRLFLDFLEHLAGSLVADLILDAFLQNNPKDEQRHYQKKYVEVTVKSHRAESVLAHYIPLFDEVDLE